MSLENAGWKTHGESPAWYKKLNLGCGPKRPVDDPAFIRVDSNPAVEPDVRMDFEEQKPWPFEDSSIHEVYCSHLIEHIVHLDRFFEELYRVCKNGAKCRFLTPHWLHEIAWSDPTHKRAITERTYAYFSAEGRKALGVEHYGWKSNFEIVRVQRNPEDSWYARSDEAREWASTHYANVIKELDVTLRCVK